MSQVTLQGQPIRIDGTFPAVGQTAPDFVLTANDLSDKTLADFAGKRKVLNIFPSIDTGVCATSVRQFNQRAAALDNAVVLCIAADLPFAMARFCGAEGIDNVITLSSFRSGFAQDYGVAIADSPLRGLTARSVLVGRKQPRDLCATRSRNQKRTGLRCRIGRIGINFPHKKQPALRKIKVQAAFSALCPFGRKSRIFQSIFRQPLTCNEI